MKVNYDTFSISHIGEKTYIRYIMTQGIQEMEGLEYNDALEFALGLNTEEKKELLLNNLPLYSELFFGNIKDNVQGKSTFLLYPNEYKNVSMADQMKSMNEKTWYVHLLFMSIGIVLFLVRPIQEGLLPNCSSSAAIRTSILLHFCYGNFFFPRRSPSNCITSIVGFIVFSLSVLFNQKNLELFKARGGILSPPESSKGIPHILMSKAKFQIDRCNICQFEPF